MSKYMDDNELWELGAQIMEIKILLAEQKVMIKEMQKDLRDHAERDGDRQSQLSDLRSDVDKAKGSLSVMKWVAPTAPAIIILALKSFGVF